MKYALLRSAFIILMCYLQVEFPFWSENERSSRETPCRLSKTRSGLRETSNRLSENSPLLSERIINKRTRTVKTGGSLKYFLAGPFFILGKYAFLPRHQTIPNLMLINTL
jgi:hypothetical protein